MALRPLNRDEPNDWVTVDQGYPQDDPRNPNFDVRSPLQRRLQGASSEPSDWQTVQPHVAKKAGFWETAGQHLTGFAKGTADIVNTAIGFHPDNPMVLGPMDPVGAGTKLAHTIVDPALNRGYQSAESFGAGDPLTGTRQALEAVGAAAGTATGTPAGFMMGPAEQSFTDAAVDDNLPGAFGGLAADVAIAKAPEAGEYYNKTVRPAIGRAQMRLGRAEYDRATPSTPIKYPNESGAQIDARRQENLNYGIENDLGYSKKGLKQQDRVLNETGRDIGNVTKGNTETAPIGRIIAATRKAEAGVLPTERPVFEDVRNMFLDEFRDSPTSAVRNPTWEQLQKAKTKYGKEAAKAEYGSPKHAAFKAIEDTARDMLVEQFPELEDMYGKYSTGLDFRKNTRTLGKGTPRGGRPLSWKDTIGGLVGGGIGTVIAGLPGGGAGATIGTIAGEVLHSPAVRSRIALELYKSGKARTIEVAKATVAERLQAMRENPPPMPFGLSIRHVKESGETVQIPTTPNHVVKLMAQAITDSPDKTLSGATKYAAENFGQEWNVGTRAGKQKPMQAAEAYKKAKVWLKQNPPTDTATYQGYTERGKAAVPADFDWYRGGIKDYAEQSGIPDADMKKFVDLAGVLSPQVGVDVALDMATGAMKAFKNGASDYDIMKAMHSTTMERKNVAMGVLHAGDVPTGRKVGPFSKTTSVLFGGDEPMSTTVDRHSAGASGYDKNFNNGQWQFMDARQRAEAKRTGVDRLDKAQAYNWIGKKGADADAAQPYLSYIQRAIEKHGGPEQVFAKDTNFDFGDNAPEPVVQMSQRAKIGGSALVEKSDISHITSRAAAGASRDMEAGGGFTINRTGKPLTSGYSVVPYQERSVPYERPINAHDLQDYARKNADLLGKENHNLGGWKEGDKRWVEISIHEPSLAKALDLAREHKQKAIWDHSSNKEIPMSGVGSAVFLKDGRVLLSDFVEHANSRRLPTHLSIIENAGIDPSQVADTGWIIDGKIDIGGGGTIGKSEFTLGEYEAKKAAAALEDVPGIRVYHGSPHDFEKPDLSKIGTGEGAQAYGHGFYAAESPDVAKKYTNAGSAGYLNSHVQRLAQDALDKTGNIRDAKMELNKRAGEVSSSSVRQSLYDAANNIEKLTDGSMGNLYEAEIPRAAAEKMLDWDKPLSEHSPHVRAALNKLAKEFPDVGEQLQDFELKNSTGMSIYAALDRMIANDKAMYDKYGVASHGGRGSDAAASQILRDAGIPGIKYLDGMSRIPKDDMLAISRNGQQTPLETSAQRFAARVVIDLGEGSPAKALELMDTESYRPEVYDTLRQWVSDGSHISSVRNKPTSNYVLFDVDVLKDFKKRVEIQQRQAEVLRQHKAKKATGQ